eukprot:418601-Pelagomonas_calceolata.AAC.11
MASCSMKGCWIFIIVYSLTVSVGIAIGIGIGDSFDESSIAALAAQVCGLCRYRVAEAKGLPSKRLTASQCIHSHSIRMHKMSDFRENAPVFPHYVQRRREQHCFGNGVKGRVGYVHDMLCASIPGAIGHVRTAKCISSLEHSANSCHETPDTCAAQYH